MKYTKIPQSTFKELQLNAGVLLSKFDPKTGSLNLDDIIAATSGGNKFSAVPDMKDLGDGIDNAPSGVMELAKLTKWNADMTGNFVTVNTQSVKRLLSAADVDSEDSAHIVPRSDLSVDDFQDLWWVGDYSDKNDEDAGGFIAIHMMNSLSTGGFTLQSSDDGNGTFAYTFKAHYTMEDQTMVPFEIWVKAGAGQEE